MTAALDGSLKNAKFRTDPYFGFSVPTQLGGVEPHLLYPYKTWQNKLEFDETARKLVDMFQKNFVQFEDHVDRRRPRRRAGSAHRRRVVSDRTYAFQARHGVSGTGVSGGLPSAQARMLSTMS